MELKDFIARTLSEIAQGVRAAQDATQALDARINPFTSPSVGARSRKLIDVEFNVAVSETEGTATSGRIGVLAGIVGLAAQGQSSAGNAAATSIKFTVPMILPSESDKSKGELKPVATSRRRPFVQTR